MLSNSVCPTGLEEPVGIERKGKIKQVAKKSKLKKICGKTKSGRVKCFYKGEQYAVNKGKIIDQVFGKIFQNKVDKLNAKFKGNGPSKGVSVKGQDVSNQSVDDKKSETGTEEVDEDADEAVGEVVGKKVSDPVLNRGKDGSKELDTEIDKVIGETEEDPIEKTEEEAISENGTEVIDEDISLVISKVDITESVKNLNDVTNQFIQDYINKHHLNKTEIDNVVSDYTNKINGNIGGETGTEEIDEEIEKDVEEEDEVEEDSENIEDIDQATEDEVIDAVIDGTEEIDEEEQTTDKKEEQAASTLNLPGFDPTKDLFVYRWKNWKLIFGKILFFLIYFIFVKLHPNKATNKLTTMSALIIFSGHIEDQMWTSHNNYKGVQQTPKPQPNKHHAYLFELDSDPSERTNVADRFPFIVDLLAGKVNDYINDVVIIKHKKISNRGRMSKVWKPWVKLRDLDKSLGKPLNLDKSIRGGKVRRRKSNKIML